jgi:hypothetical protein
MDVIPVKGMKRSERDPKQSLALLNKMREICKKDDRFKGMSNEEILEKLRETREKVWNEITDEVGTRR